MDHVAELEEHDEDYACEKCEEQGTDEDPVAHFKHPTEFGGYVMAHGQCGEDAGLELA